MALSTFSLLASALFGFEGSDLGLIASKLRYLCLRDNGLRALSNSSLAGLPLLERLDIYDEPRLSYPLDVFKPVPRLLHLRLEDVGITRVTAALLAPLTSLQFLSLTDNPLVEFAIQGLAPLPLRKLYLRDTQLRVLNASMLTPLPKLELLDIGRAPLVECPDTTFDSVPLLQELEWSASVSNVLAIVVTARHLYPLTKLRNLDLDNHRHSRDDVEQWGLLFAQR